MVPWLTREHLREELTSFMDDMLAPQISQLGQRILDVLISELHSSNNDMREVMKSNSEVILARSAESKASGKNIVNLNYSNGIRDSEVEVAESSPQPMVDKRLSLRSSRGGGAHKQRLLRLSENNASSEEANFAEVGSATSIRSGSVVRASCSADSKHSWIVRHRRSYKEPVYNVLQEWQPPTEIPSLNFAGRTGSRPSAVKEDSPRQVTSPYDTDAESIAGSAAGSTALVQAVGPMMQAASGWVMRAGAHLWNQRHQESYRQLNLTQKLVINALPPTSGERPSSEEAALESEAVYGSEEKTRASTELYDSEEKPRASAGFYDSEIFSDGEAAGTIAFDETEDQMCHMASERGSALAATTPMLKRSLSRTGLAESLRDGRAGDQSFRRPNRSQTAAPLVPQRGRSSAVRNTRRLPEDIMELVGLDQDVHHLDIHHHSRSNTSQTEDFQHWDSEGPLRINAVGRNTYILMAHVVQSPAFAYAVSILVLLNAALLGIQTDYMARHWTHDIPFAFKIMEKMLCLLFFLELALRIYVFGCAFFTMPGWKANIFDLTVIVLQVFDEFVLASFSGIIGGSLEDVRSPLFTFGGSSPLPLVRMLRLLRLVRVASLLHLLTELRMLVISIADSIKSVVWVLFLLFMIMYCIGVYFTQVVTLYKVNHRREGHGVHTALEENYGTLLQTMLSLFESIASGVSWREVLDPLWQHCSPWMLVFFLGYVFFTIFVVLNVVTGVFVGSATEKANEDRKKVLMFQLRELFRAADVDNDGTMNWSKFQGKLQDPKMQGYLKAIDLDQEEALDLFHLLDSDDSDEIDEDEFVNGCIRLHGYAKSIDLATFMFDYKNYTNMWSEHAYRIERSLEEMMDRLMSLQEAAGRYDVSV